MPINVGVSAERPVGLCDRSGLTAGGQANAVNQREPRVSTMGHSVSTSAIWGANSLSPSPDFSRRCAEVVDSAVFENRLTPMLHLNDVVTVFDGLCVESDVTMLRLAEIQGRRCAGLMAPMMEGAETKTDTSSSSSMYG